jgi:N-methylhydantoinase A
MHPAPQPILAEGPLPAPGGTVPVSFPGGRREVPVFDRATLPAGATLPGPAIVTQLDTTTLIAPGWTGTVHASGAILLERDPA